MSNIQNQQMAVVSTNSAVKKTLSVSSAVALNYPQNIIFGHIIIYMNIKSIRNKFSDSSEMIGINFDVSTISGTKIDSTFPMNRYIIYGFKSPYKPDVSGNSCGILVIVREGLLYKKCVGLVGTQPDIEVVPIGINVGKQKWLILPIYRPPRQSSEYFVEDISKLFDKFSRYDVLIVLGDFNLGPDIITLSLLVYNYNLHNMIKQPTIFKSFKGCCIELIFTYRKH